MDRGKGKEGRTVKQAPVMSNIIKRGISGVIFVAVIIGSIYSGPLIFSMLFGIVTVGSLIEYFRMVYGKGQILRKISGVLTGIYIYTVTTLWFSGPHATPEAFAWLIPLIFLPFVAELWQKSAQPFTMLGLYFTGLIYIALPFSLLSGIAYGAEQDFAPEILLCMFAFIWINDTGAYITGSRWGKHPLFSRISPKKTVEGSLGGMALVVIAAFVIARLQDGLSLQECLAMGLILSVFSVLGDLVESMLKRSAGFKDSGNIMPGHGGFLDRFDAMIGAVPFLYFYFSYLR